MSNKLISDLASSSGVSDDDLFELENPGSPSTSEKATAQQLKNYINTREKLTSDREYFVDTASGSDMNDGLTSGNAFATIQKAIDTAAALDLSIFKVTINVADGTYSENLIPKSYVGNGPIEIIGDMTTPSNVVLDGVDDNCFESTGVIGTYDLWGIKFTVSSGDGFAINAKNLSTVRFGLVDFGDCQWHVVASFYGYIEALDDFTISALEAGHASLNLFAMYAVPNPTKTILIVGTLSQANRFVQAGRKSCINFAGGAFDLSGGSVTGTRFNVQELSLIRSGDGSSTYFPGDAAGTEDSATFGLYT